MGSYKVCVCFSRKFKSDTTSPPNDIKDIFTKYSENGHMSVKNLQKFLVEVQGQRNVSENDAQHIIDRLPDRRHLTIFNRHGLTLEAFFHYLMKEELNPSIDNNIHHDMTAPLSHYFIYTGHNSYLTGNQLSSDCSDAPIIKALKRGLRVIELDIWPNPSKDDVLVLHGRTLTSPVKFIKCIRSIKEHAFVASQYPVIITLEDHLTPDLQAKVAEMITETFGEMLFYPNSEGLKEFPSPETLKGRILISTKPPKEYLESKSSKKLANGDKEEQKPPEEEPWGDEIRDYEEDMSYGEKTASDPGPIEEDFNDGSVIPQEKAEAPEAPEYKRIITIHAGKPKGESLKDTLTVDDKYVKRVSLSEPQLEKFSKSFPAHLVRFTQKNILRIYPKGTRITSSNYNPLIAWTHGAQMVALNMQGYGRKLWLVHGFFLANGGCGYVKKPEFLLPNANNVDVDDQNIFNPIFPRPVKTTLKVKVYMGDGWMDDFNKTHFDTYSPPDFYTRIGIAGVPLDTIMKRTRAIEDDWTPRWETEFVFPLTVPELAILRIEVHEYDMTEKDDFGGQACLPVVELKSGIRSIPLYDKKGEKYNNVRLLVRIDFVS
eukprot:Gb_38146 [translate_table: standard]